MKTRRREDPILHALASVGVAWPPSMLIYYGILALDGLLVVALLASAWFAFGTSYLLGKYLNKVEQRDGK